MSSTAPLLSHSVRVHDCWRLHKASDFIRCISRLFVVGSRGCPDEELGWNGNADPCQPGPLVGDCGSLGEPCVSCTSRTRDDMAKKFVLHLGETEQRVRAAPVKKKFDSSPTLDSRGRWPVSTKGATIRARRKRHPTGACISRVCCRKTHMYPYDAG